MVKGTPAAVMGYGTANDVIDRLIPGLLVLLLGCSVCVAHTCRCGALVDAQGIHDSVCKQAPSRIARYQAINDVIA